MINIKTFYFNELRVCCYVVWDEETKECIIIDPGCNSASELKRLEKYITENNLIPSKIVLTHGHFDHIMGLKSVSELFGLKVYLHKEDECQIVMARDFCARFGFEIDDPTMVEKEFFADGEDITFGASSLKVISTPGHTKGGVCLYNAKQGILFSGDTLFAHTIGRTDHPGGDHAELIESIISKLAILPPDTEVLPGHGPNTTIGEEVVHNPFLQRF